MITLLMDRIKYRSVTEKLNEKKQHRVEPNVKNEIKISEKYINSEEQKLMRNFSMNIFDKWNLHRIRFFYDISVTLWRLATGF